MSAARSPVRAIAAATVSAASVTLGPRSVSPTGELLDDPTRVRDHHGERGRRSDLDEVERLDRLPGGPRTDGHGRVAGHVGEQVGGGLKKPTELVVDRRVEGLDPRLGGRPELAGSQMIDVVAVRLGGGHPPGGRVRLVGVSVTLQRRQFRSYGRRGDVQIGRLEHRLRTDRFAGLDVQLDQRPQNLVTTFFSRILHGSHTVVHSSPYAMRQPQTATIGTGAYPTATVSA